MDGVDSRILEGIRVMAALADVGSFVRAGHALDMSQSGVSRAIARLEQRLGSRLFDRTTRSVRLTDDGRRFHAQVMPLLAALAEATATAAGGNTAVRGRLRVNVDPFFSRLVLGPRLGEFLQRHPALKLELVTRDRLGDLVADGFDLAIRFGYPPPSALVARTLLETRVITAAAPAYLARHTRPKDPKELQDGGHVCVQFRDPVSGRPFPWEFRRKRRRLRLDLQGPLTVNEAGLLQSVCLAGFGICQLLEIGSEPMFADGRLVDLFPEWADERFPLTAYHPSRNHLPGSTRAFTDFVVDLLR